MNSLSVTSCYELEELRCVQNSLESLNFYSLRSLKTLVCGNNPDLTEIDWSRSDETYDSLETLECWNTGLKTLDISEFAKLTYLACYGDEMQSVYVPDVCEGETVDISKLKVDLTRYKTEIDPEEVDEDEDGSKVYPNETSYYSAVSMLETGSWENNGKMEQNEQTGEVSIFKPQTTTFKARIGGDETDVLLPSYGVVYDDKNEVAGVVRIYGSFFTLPEILLKQNNFDHWKNSTDGTATLLDPLRFDPVHGKELTMYFDLPYEIDEKWIDEANGLDAYGLKLADEFAESSLFEDCQAVLLFPGTDTRFFAQTGFGLADVAIDCDPRGVGYGQYETHKSSFQRWLERNDDKASPNVYGYSLGAALAQWTISDYREKLQFVELFNAPGISVEAADKFDSSRVEKLTYHIASGDPVSMAGETVLSGGDVWIYSYESSTESGSWIFAKHLSPLSAPYSFAGDVQQEKQALKYERPNVDAADISSDVYRSFWFHYDDADYTTWRTNAVLSALAPDVLAVRGTTEQGRAKLKGVVKPIGETLLPFSDILTKFGSLITGAVRLYDLPQYRLEFGNGWKLEQINEDLTCVDGKLSAGTVKVTTPNGWEFDGTLNYGTSDDKKYGLEALTVAVEAEKQLGRDSSYYIKNATLTLEKAGTEEWEPVVPEPNLSAGTPLALRGNDGTIAYKYCPSLGANEELATIKGTIKISDDASVSDATLCVGDASGHFFALGQTNKFAFTTNGANGKFDEITLSTDYGVREQNVNYFKLQDATVVWDKQGKVMGFRECVTITGTLTVGKQTLSVEARYFGRDDWEVAIDAGLGGKTLLTPNNPRFTTLEPVSINDLGEISATSAASASVFNASESVEKTRVSVANDCDDAASLSRLDVADAPTAVLRCEWSNDCD
ncbi:MAG: leucine-rich repeat domain-containing protein, partial [Thermoguttaceae bacterium]|nr:leucine-rich repeat domain-containing protein [Thermoguttaceae bacterium]